VHTSGQYSTHTHTQENTDLFIGSHTHGYTNTHRIIYLVTHLVSQSASWPCCPCNCFFIIDLYWTIISSRVIVVSNIRKSPEKLRVQYAKIQDGRRKSIKEEVQFLGVILIQQLKFVSLILTSNLYWITITRRVVVHYCSK